MSLPPTPAEIALALNHRANQRSPAATAHHQQSRATAAQGRAAMTSADDRGSLDETNDMGERMLVDCFKMPPWC
ncbi:MAG: hypothetical protein AAFR79_08570 [Pseudomonadota bacterium]